MWHPEQTWSVLHDERHRALVAPLRQVATTDEGPGPDGPEHHARTPQTLQSGPARVPVPVLVAARVRRALARLVTA